MPCIHMVSGADLGFVKRGLFSRGEIAITTYGKMLAILYFL